MASRPQLDNPNTSYSTTRYDVEFKSLNEMWCLDFSFPRLIEAQARKSLNISDGIESRIIVVSETWRLIP